MGRREQRAADADREAVAERLREAVTEGRLDLDEFDERLVRAYRAKTYGELDPLVVDLPRPSAASRAATTTPAAHAVRGWLSDLWRPWAITVSICVTIWLLAVVSAGMVAFWPAWVAVPWGAVLVGRSIYGLASGEPQHWAAKQARVAGPPC